MPLALASNRRVKTVYLSKNRWGKVYDLLHTLSVAGVHLHGTPNRSAANLELVPEYCKIVEVLQYCLERRIPVSCSSISSFPDSKIKRNFLRHNQGGVSLDVNNYVSNIFGLSGAKGI